MKILVIGLRSKDTQKLINNNTNKDLTFISSDSITNKSLKCINKYDYIINMCKFTSHLVEYLCNQHKGFIRLRPTQGYSTVNSIIKDLQNDCI